MECCWLVVAIIILILIVAFGVMFLSFIVGVFGGVYIVLHEKILSGIRFLWLFRLEGKMDSSVIQAQQEKWSQKLSDLLQVRSDLNSERNIRVSIKDEASIVLIDYRLDLNEARVNDANARIALLQGLSPKKNLIEESDVESDTSAE